MLDICEYAVLFSPIQIFYLNIRFSSGVWIRGQYFLRFECFRVFRHDICCEIFTSINHAFSIVFIFSFSQSDLAIFQGMQSGGWNFSGGFNSRISDLSQARGPSKNKSVQQKLKRRKTRRTTCAQCTTGGNKCPKCLFARTMCKQAQS